MKKILTLALALLMIVSFSACTNDTSVDEPIEETVSNKTESMNNSADSSDINSENETDAESKPENTDDSDDLKDTAESVVETPQKPDKPEIQEKPDTQTENNSADNNKPSDSNNNKTLGNKLLSEFKSVAGSGSALSVAEKLSGYSELSVLPMGAMEVEPGFLTGFDNAEISGFKEGAMFAPMMGTIPFVGYVFTLEDGADVSAFISNLSSNANRRWNICTEAEETVSGSVGNKVFFVMCNKSLEE